MIEVLRRHAAVVWLVAISLAVIGSVSILRLPSSIYPEMRFPRVVVVAHSGQLAPNLVEAQVTRPLEQALATVPGVRHVRARTIRGAAGLSLQLTDDTDPLRAQNASQTAVDRVELPKGTTTIVERVLPTSVPVVTFNLGAANGSNVDARRLRDVAERIVRPAFVRIAGVGAVELQGGRTRQVVVQLRPAELAALHMTPSQLVAKLAAADVIAAAGHVFDEHQALPVVLDAQASDIQSLANVPIGNGPAGPILLSAVADVFEGAADPDVIVRGPRGEVVAVSVARLPGASTVAVVDAVKHVAATLRNDRVLPPDVELTPVYDQAELVTESMASVRDAIVLGVLLALMVIAVSLRDWRAGLIAAVPIPVTLLGTFAIMSWLGVSLNLMSLGGLAVAIGLVVDDAIVVAEGIVVRVEEGHETSTAIEMAMHDMAGAVIGTTLTTVVVFAPLALLSGVTGSFLGAFALTLATAVLLSLALALTLIPLLAKRLRRKHRKHHATSSDRVGRAIRFFVHRRWLPAAVIVLLAGIGLLAQRSLPTGFLPAMDEGAFVIDFFLPAGTSLEDTDRITLEVDRVLARMPEIAAFTRRTGTELGPAAATMQNRGDIMVKLVAPSQRRSIDTIINRVRTELATRVPEARFEYIQVLQDVLADLAGTPAPIEIRVLGDNVGAMDAWAEQVGKELTRRPELVDVFDGREGLTPILRATIDSHQLSRLGLDASTVASDLETAITGRVIAQILRPERTIDVRIRYPDTIRYSATSLAQSPIAYGPRLLPLGEIVTFDRPVSRAVLRRDGLRSAIVMQAATPSGDLGAAETAVREALKQVPPPRGTQIEIGGQAASGAASRRELLVVAAIALVLVLVVLLVQLESWRVSLVVLLTAPLSTVGGLLVLAVAGIPLNISSLTGLILLVGLVVKNGILLLEYAQRLCADGQSVEDAIVAAARRRLRPIVMTTAATLAGLAPLALGIGAGAALQRPLAIAVIGGLALATAVTLVVTPALAAVAMRRRGT